MTVLEAFALGGRTAVVTGASRGLGLAAARALAEAGADIAMTARDLPRLRESAKEIAAETGRRVLPFALDVTDVAAVDAGMAQIAAALGPPSILLNNAGIERQARLEDMEEEDWTAVLATNLSAVFACSRAFMRHAGTAPASIINMASIGAAAGVSAQSAYCASKGGVVSASRALAVELAPRGVRVNAIAPGYFATDMPAAVIADPAMKERLLRRVPLGRLAEPAEIGPLVVYLASDAAAFMTGSILYLDGGYTAQ
jgi:NAD(P)-dependent dehydrogenase (short-subunit alcohol dehydrogenase family)